MVHWSQSSTSTSCEICYTCSICC